MNPPTKFQKMRIGRTRLEIAAEREPVTELHEQRPSVPTMEIDGVRYREASDNDAVTPCFECAFYDAGCHERQPHWRKAEQAFGGDCIERKVIYIKAE